MQEYNNSFTTELMTGEREMPVCDGEHESCQDIIDCPDCREELDQMEIDHA